MDNLDTLVEVLNKAQRVFFITGAGISADSGLPTYRGVGGLYDGNETEEGYRIEEALSATVFSRHPDITWKYLWQIGHACAAAKPNAAHTLISELQAYFEKVCVLTQNVDGLHRAAGSQSLIEIHGHAFDLYCMVCGASYQAEKLIDDYRQGFNKAPHCPDCGGLVRPNVVLFEEMLPERELQLFYDAMSVQWDVVIAIGTSAAFPYIIEPVVRAAQQGIYTVDINPGTSQLSSIVDLHVPTGAAQAMQGVRERLKNLPRFATLL